MKRKVISILLNLSLIFMTIFAIYLYQKGSYLEEQINLNFKNALMSASKGFASNEKNIASKSWDNFYYNQAMTNLSVAAYLYEYTSYYKNNKSGLNINLDNLSSLMAQDKYKDVIMSQAGTLRQDLLDLWLDPYNKNAAESISHFESQIWGK